MPTLTDRYHSCHVIDEGPLLMVTAVATASLTGPLALQGDQAALGLRWWAARAGVTLEVVDDGGSVSAAAAAYRRWIDEDVDILFGPYGSNLVRSVILVVNSAGVVMWNHGGAADDLAHPLVVHSSHQHQLTFGAPSNMPPTLALPRFCW